MNEASDNIFLSAPVEPEDKGMRLDKFLARAFSEISRSQLQRLIACYAVVEIPGTATLPRFIVLPPSAEGRTEIIFVDDIIRLCLDEVFFMFDYDRIEAYAFKFMRDAEMSLDDDVNKSIVEKMEQGIDKRKHGRPVRMVYDKEMPADLLETLTAKLGLKAGDNVSPGGRYHLMRDLMKFPKASFRWIG